MNCREVERRIYLYSELSPLEREETDRHLDGCANCKQVADRAGALREMTSASHAPVMSDASALTRRIMNALPERQAARTPLLDFFRLSLLNTVRSGLAALSLFLVFFFANEYSRGVQFTEPVRPYHAAGPAVLNTFSFQQALKAIREKKKGSRSLYECVANCVRTQEAMCSDCGIKFLKPTQTP